MRQVRRSNNDIPKTKSKLTVVNKQISNLDKEIQEIQNELNFSRSMSADKLLDDVNIFPSSKRQGQKLYQQSIQVMNKRAEKNVIEEDPVDIAPQFRTNIHIKGYRPPEERIFDVNERKNQLIAQIQEEREKEILEKCTFKPEINPLSKDIKYDPNHLLRPKKKEAQKKPDKKTSQKSNNNKVQIGIYERQIEKAHFVQPKKELGNVITPRSEKQMVDRLTKQKNDVNLIDENNNSNKKYVSKQAIDRLVFQSIKKDIPEVVEEEVKEKPKCFMNKKSKEIMRNRRVDLFEEYKCAKERVRQKNEEIKEWRKLTEQNENDRNEKMKYPKIDTTKNPNVAGMDEYIERMKTRPLPKYEEEPIPTAIPPVVITKPFKFDIREEVKKQHFSNEVDNILNDIDELLKHM
ncbi:hypothetical protein TRFO_42879 [Tritrichomonas foetus]|uniref:Uncharacterized protein n=1 Tax=Tritrichomonas foetus TaxID=1144522 RepID=A0A1J4KYZ2_9EUKA|nr:hypothetical protein TRFO_42879 [Tritrichomonas foetus]|eukprot:OHT14805.1 hypothetical protein TRFO_42879 [Tritrichomonas foetus]